MQFRGRNIILFLTDGDPNDDPEKKIYPAAANGQKKLVTTFLKYVFTYCIVEFF